MGKTAIGSKEVFQRINYLYQVAHLVLAVNPRNVGLVRFYVNTLKTLAKRQVLRLHPDIKRTLCKRCYTLLIPGVTSIVRTKHKREKHTVVTCLECGLVKRFAWKPDYDLWPENPSAWLQDKPTSTCWYVKGWW